MSVGRAAGAVLRGITAALLLSGAVQGLAEEKDPGTPGEAVVRRIESHYREITDLTASMVQRNVLTTINRTQAFEGTLSVRKPGRLRIDYTNGQIVVLDGKTVWIYSKKSKQALRRTFQEVEQANVPVAFLLGASEISGEFTVAGGDDSAGSVDLLPRKQGAAMQKLRLVADDAGRILSMNLYDRSGNGTEITFSEVKENAGVPEGMFEFKVPKGTEIIDQ